MTQARFKAMVEKAKEYIAAGDIYQANLSQRFSFGYEGSSLELYEKLRAINPSPFSCFLKTGSLEIVSSSPERLIRKKGRVCETRPIAGTCPARGPAKRLAEWRRKLLQNEKEKAEHLMLVDLERNDLGRVCGYRSVKVGEFMTLERYSHVVHIVSKVMGDLKKGKDAFDVIRAMFPGGTITGCPKIRCMQIIDELEPVRRGIYTGSLGYIDFYGDMDLNIVIRTIVLRKGKGQLQVGAGIVYDSDPEKEYEETLHKAEALVKALREASI
jgi:anthranilate/para-aminobenzoate synthase component I